MREIDGRPELKARDAPIIMFEEPDKYNSFSLIFGSYRYNERWPTGTAK